MKAALRIGAVTAGAALALGAAGSAFAAAPNPSASAGAGSDRLATVKSLASSRIQGRLTDLHSLQLAVSDSKYLSSSERSTLGNQISSDISGLTALATKVSGETTASAVRADEVQMVDAYRVYMLMDPQAHLTEALAAEAEAASDLQGVYNALSALAAKQSGGATGTQQAELADLKSELSAAESAMNGQTAAELAIQPSPDEQAIHTALEPVRDAVKTARRDLKKARDDAKDLRASLKS